MTASAPKPAYQFEDLEQSEADPFAPESPPDCANDPDAYPDHWHELPCHVDAVLDDTEQQRIEDLHGSFHEQLAVLVRALESDNEQTSNVHEGSNNAEPELEDEDGAAANAMGDAADEPWRATPGFHLLSSLQDVLNGRVRGFALGLGASIAVGGVALMLAGGSGEPQATAVSSAEGQTQVVSAPAANDDSELQLRASLLAETEAGQTEAEVNPSGPHETGIRGDEPAADIAAAVPGLVIEPAPEPEHAVSQTTIIPQARDVPGPAADAGEPERREEALTGNPTDMGMSFETTIQSAAESEPAPEEGNQPIQSLASATRPAQSAHVVKHVNMRAGPDNSAAILAVLPEGSPVEVVQCDQWCEVISGGQRGWIYRDLISGPMGG